MGKTIVKKVLSMWGVSLFVLFFAAVAVSGGAPESMTVKGKIVAINTDAGLVMIQDESGRVMNLKAGQGMDLKALSEGEKVTIESSREGVIESITKEQ